MNGALEPGGPWAEGWRAALAVGLGGFVGALLRWGTGLLATRVFAVDSHWATATVNLAGCLAIGALVAWFEQRPGTDAGVQLLVVVGGLGAFTTFSTFGLDSVRLLDAGRAWAAWGNVLVQPALGLVAVLAGRGLASKLLGS